MTCGGPRNLLWKDRGNCSFSRVLFFGCEFSRVLLVLLFFLSKPSFVVPTEYITFAMNSIYAVNSHSSTVNILTLKSCFHVTFCVENHMIPNGTTLSMSFSCALKRCIISSCIIHVKERKRTREKNVNV